ncbi:hypothetical protein MMC27_002836 [Xylographa pallens]|nr:hypothetical protein [Xylographa pallens]
MSFDGSIVKDVAKNTAKGFLETRQEENDSIGNSLITVAQSAHAESVQKGSANHATTQHHAVYRRRCKCKSDPGARDIYSIALFREQDSSDRKSTSLVPSPSPQGGGKFRAGQNASGDNNEARTTNDRDRSEKPVDRVGKC